MGDLVLEVVVYTSKCYGQNQREGGSADREKMVEYWKSLFAANC